MSKPTCGRLIVINCIPIQISVFAFNSLSLIYGQKSKFEVQMTLKT